MPNLDHTSVPTWDEFRRMMPVTQRWAYFDHAAVAPLTGAACEVLHNFATDMSENGSAHWATWNKEVEAVRSHGAALLNASLDEIAVIHNTTEGISLVAEGYPWQAGDNIVTPSGEFPSNLYPWMNLESRGVETRIVETINERLDLKKLDEACDERTRIVSVSWVGYATGWRNDVDAIAEIAHKNGALLFLDAIQGLGAFELDLGITPVDFLAADGHKWMLGPEGAGLFFVRKKHLETLRPLGVGWNSVKHAGVFDNTAMTLKQNAARYEGGSHNLAGIAALAASLECLSKFGSARISKRILELTDAMVEQLEAVGALTSSCREGDRRSGIVSFEMPGRDPRSVQKACADRHVVVNRRAGRVRVSPHAYCNEEDIERLIEAVSAAK